MNAEICLHSFLKSHMASYYLDLFHKIELLLDNLMHILMVIFPWFQILEKNIQHFTIMYDICNNIFMGAFL